MQGSIHSGKACRVVASTEYVSNYVGRQNEGTPPGRLTGGARRGLLEDSGDLPGYENILNALADETHADHDE